MGLKLMAHGSPFPESGPNKIPQKFLGPNRPFSSRSAAAPTEEASGGHGDGGIDRRRDITEMKTVSLGASRPSTVNFRMYVLSPLLNPLPSERNPRIDCCGGRRGAVADSFLSGSSSPQADEGQPGADTRRPRGGRAALQGRLHLEPARCPACTNLRFVSCFIPPLAFCFVARSPD